MRTGSGGSDDGGGDAQTRDGEEKHSARTGEGERLSKDHEVSEEETTIEEVRTNDQ